MSDESERRFAECLHFADALLDSVRQAVPDSTDNVWLCRG